MTIEARRLVREAADLEIATGLLTNETKAAFHEGIRLGFEIGTAEDPRRFVRPVTLEAAIRSRRSMGNPVPPEVLA